MLITYISSSPSCLSHTVHCQEPSISQEGNSALSLSRGQTRKFEHRSDREVITLGHPMKTYLAS